MVCLFLFFIFTVVACSSSSDGNESNDEVNPDTPDSEKAKDPDEDEKSDSEDKKTTLEKNANKNETEEESDSERDTDPKTDEGSSEGVEMSVEEHLKELGFSIFNAQHEENYEFLESILSEGSTLNKKKNSFTFDDVTYPHEQEFIQADPNDLEFRYTNEGDDESWIVGFAVVDYETESSFTIDFQFVHEDGDWKMNDMDINK